MNESINTTVFDGLTQEARQFYDQNGFVVLSRRLSEARLSELRVRFAQLKARYAAEMGQTEEQYAQHINQWRDLWKEDEAYHQALHSLCDTSQFLMAQSGVQLLHDHLISKPCGREAGQASTQGTNATLPWHQDFAFWPVNTPDSLSQWVPLEDVSADGGCMQVVQGSHRWGPGRPVDFIMDDPDLFSGRDDLSLITVPAQKGMSVVLHSLTWHRSALNQVANTSRPAYITLWIPACARYTPDETRWHPLNDNISVAPGQHLNTDHFPLFGDSPKPEAVGSGEPVNRPHLSKRMDMFRAGRHVARQISALLQEEERPLTECLADEADRQRICEVCIAQGLAAEEERRRLLELLNSLYVSAAAYDKHRARNVFSDAYAGWWHWIGTQMRQESGHVS